MQEKIRTMKNIYLLPTDKPSRLHYFTANKAGYYLYPNNELVVPRNPNCINQNIYITSDEEIKEGDWFLDDNNQISRSYRLSHVQFANPKKIILTTDQDLIKDGVQAIDDEFLKWFVKNPSCEKVDWFYSSLMKDYEYEIIIPKEEAKQEDCSCTDECLGYLTKSCKRIEEPKKETLEEAIKQELENHFFSNISEIKQAEYFINFGAKWQAERMYSETDIVLILSKFRDMKMIAFSEWFEQFKNK